MTSPSDASAADQPWPRKPTVGTILLLAMTSGKIPGPCWTEKGAPGEDKWIALWKGFRNRICIQLLLKLTMETVAVSLLYIYDQNIENCPP